MLLNETMKTIDEIRRINLLGAISIAGSATALSDKAGISAAYLSQIKNKTPESKTGKPKGMGDEVARKIEAALGKLPGWMDMNHGPDIFDRAEELFQIAGWKFHKNESSYKKKSKEESIQLEHMTLIPDFFVWNGDSGFFVEINDVSRSPLKQFEMRQLQDQGRLLLVDINSVDSIPELINDFQSQHPTFDESYRIPYFESKESVSLTPLTDNVLSFSRKVQEQEEDNSASISISQYKDVSGSMGSGVLLRDQPGEIQNWRVTPDWISKNVRNHTGVNNLCIVTGFGDSMRGMYNPGDPLLVDKGINSVEFDAVYFFRVDGEGFIKTLQRIPGVGLRAISANKDYETWTITPDMDFEVLARVIKVWESTDF